MSFANLRPLSLDFNVLYVILVLLMSPHSLPNYCAVFDHHYRYLHHLVCSGRAHFPTCCHSNDIQITRTFDRSRPPHGPSSPIVTL